MNMYANMCVNLHSRKTSDGFLVASLRAPTTGPRGAAAVLADPSSLLPGTREDLYGDTYLLF